MNFDAIVFVTTDQNKNIPIYGERQQQTKELKKKIFKFRWLSVPNEPMCIRSVKAIHNSAQQLFGTVFARITIMSRLLDIILSNSN